MSAQHHRGDFPAKSRELRKLAKPDSVCWRCGQGARPNDPWQAGHKVAGDTRSGLALEHTSCNARNGQSLRYKPQTTTARRLTYK